jgi:hypothetical protein
MSTTLRIPSRSTAATSIALVPLLGMLVLTGAAWSLATLAPIGFSIAIVFLFAGPHNWFEARYMLQRMPARWGPLWRYFAIGIAGTLLLTGALAALSLAARGGRIDGTAFYVLLAVWNSLLITWVVGLALLRANQNPRRHWPWLVPLGLIIGSIAWLWPLGCSLALVYVHPLMSLCFLDRELARTRAAWHTTYRAMLVALPFLLIAMWLLLARSPHLPGDSELADAITSHAGGGILANVSTHLLVSTHTFLEMLHYGVWILAIPTLRLTRWPWQVEDVPLARRSSAWRRVVLSIVVAGASVTVLLWLGFAADYPLTRDVYFTVATLHVLAEVPFLLRLL